MHGDNKDLSVGLADRVSVDEVDKGAVGSQHSDDADHIALTEEKLQMDVDCRHLEELHSYSGGSLPLYGGKAKHKKFLALIDTGASASYISSRLCKDLKGIEVDTREVETAGGHRLEISKKVVFSFSMADCNMQVEAYVLNTRFDIILGRNWLAAYV